MILTIDQARQALSTLIYAWFPEGERPSLVTGKWDSIKLLGAVSDAGETFFLPCEESFILPAVTTVRYSASRGRRNASQTYSRQYHQS